LKHIGNALLVQQRVSGLVAVAEKPDVVWERADLERFYARLEDEYELKERADLLTRKLTVISDTAKALADIIDTERSLRLERIIIALILLETILLPTSYFCANDGSSPKTNRRLTFKSRTLPSKCRR
jgi:uncharacterized Rmd1/YagE family protein